MKICVLNLSGNVGKSTLAVHLLAAFNPASKIVSVESINATNADDVTSLDVENISASRFKDIFREIMFNDDVIVDVGASNVSQFMNEITRYKSAVGEFDMVLVPTVPADKQQRDTIASIEWLTGLGIDGKKIRVVFNQFPTNTEETVEMTYSQVCGYLMSEGSGKAIFQPLAVVRQNEIFEIVKATGKTIKELAEDPTDWAAARKAAKADKNMDLLESAIEGQMNHDLALATQDNLAEVHANLFKKGKSK